MTVTTRLVILLSGGGTTFQNLLDRIAAGELSARIVGVISNRGEVKGVERARTAGVPVEILETGPEFSERVFAAVRRFEPDLVLLAGWLKLLTIPPDFEQRVLNIHPSLLPAFGGKGMYGHKVHEAVIAAGAKVSGCTVHFADNSYDTGPILLQRTVPVHENDTPDTLAARVFAAECDAYPEAIRLWASRQN